MTVLCQLLFLGLESIGILWEIHTFPHSRIYRVYEHKLPGFGLFMFLPGIPVKLVLALVLDTWDSATDLSWLGRFCGARHHDTPNAAAIFVANIDYAAAA